MFHLRYRCEMCYMQELRSKALFVSLRSKARLHHKRFAAASQAHPLGSVQDASQAKRAHVSAPLVRP